MTLAPTIETDRLRLRPQRVEAARSARDYAYDTLGWTTAVRFISPDNVRSLALAQRLGAIYDPHAKSISEERVVFRHPRPEALR